MKKFIISTLIFFVLTNTAFSSKFDELDKPPEGAHKGQILLGAFITLGGVFGDIIDAEHDFVDGSIYTFSDSEITKKLWIDHLFFSYGLGFEYMVIDHLGVKLKIRRNIILQKTLFGPEYKNWREYLYNDFSFYVGPVAHVTNRKRWDFTLTPVVGFAVGTFKATPIARKLISGYVGNRERDIKAFTCGAEINFTAYFTGGLFISLGADWTMTLLNFDPKFSLTNTQTGNVYFQGKDSSHLHSICFILSVGYAFFN